MSVTEIQLPPDNLNGYPVIASGPRKNMVSAGALVVMIDRNGGYELVGSFHHRYVVATWYPTSESSWHCGYYFEEFTDAVQHYQELLADT